MLRPDGKLVLIDFGTARQLTQTVVNGRIVTVIHSIGYTAPEQLMDTPFSSQIFMLWVGLSFI